MKNLFWIILFMGIIPFSCVCPDVNNEFIFIKSVDSYTQINGLNDSSIPITKEDHLVIGLEFNDFDYIASNQFNFNPFVQSAMAFSCIEPGSGGLKYRIVSIVIFSDSTFFDRPAGADLSDFFSGDYEDTSGKFIKSTVSEMAADINNSESTINEHRLVLDSIPATTEHHQFSIHLKLENGGILPTQSDRVRFN